MVKVKGPLFSIDARGTLGEAITFKDGHGGVRVEQKPVPSDRRSAAQMAQRSSYSSCVDYWRGLDELRKAICVEEGERLCMTGFNFCIRECLLGRQIGLPGLDAQAYLSTINAQAHIDYCLLYPVTYEFAIPDEGVGYRGWHKHTPGGEWEELPVKIASDVYSGIECVRFDYANNKAYLSVAFDAFLDSVYLAVSDSQGGAVEITFVRVTPYYDNKKAVVTLMADSDHSLAADVNGFCNACRDRGIWGTYAIYTIDPDEPFPWAAMQLQLNGGLIEAGAHSRTHPWCPYADYDSEIGGCKSDIVSNLDLLGVPYGYYKRGGVEYVPAWSEPFGDSDALVSAKLGEYKYLCDRDITVDYGWAGWDAVNGVYGGVGASGYWDDDSLVTLNAAFNYCYTNGLIHHVWGHPFRTDFGAGAKFCQHLDYIKNKPDVWYVGFGAMYMYHYCEERGKIAVAKVAA